MSEECFIALPSKYVIWNMWYVIADQYIQPIHVLNTGIPYLLVYETTRLIRKANHHRQTGVILVN